ncbi:SusE domain-containing protein [uncultured Muribaculum sp.]|uniref:SusE domain-containing protein n=1 Tax=uncultured Muribaculum sp. TaxID=1918613 RepID=UPI00258F28F0|nr:SusE domain-containing protein [uncultured Muribaculum sp.]
MNKISIFMAAAALAVGITSCETDKEPVYHAPTTFILQAPENADAPVDLKAGNIFSLNCTRPDYGYQAVTNYTVLISLTEDFTKTEEVEPIKATSPEMTFDDATISKAICNLLGYDDDNHPETFDYEKVWFRAVAQIAGIESSLIESNDIVFAQIKPFYPAPAESFLYTPGNTNGWNQLNSQYLLSNNNTNYAGYAVLDEGGFKFSTGTDWNNGTNYGKADQPGKLSDAGSAGNLSVDKKGLYWCEVDIKKLSYTTTLCSTYGLVGDAVGGWNNSVELTPSADFLTWEGNIEFGSGEFKFRANNDWALNLGTDLTNLQWNYGGANPGNIPSPGTGTYHVVLSFAKLPYSATITKI